MTYVFVGVLVVVLLLVFQRRNFMRLYHAATAQFGKLARAVYGADPVAMYQNEVDRVAEEIREASSGLEQYQGLVTRLQRQVTSDEKEVARLTVRVKGFLQNNDQSRATEYAVLLKKAENSLAENRTQLKNYEDAYQASLKKIRAAHQRLDAAKEKADRLKADLQLSKVEAETVKLAEKFNVRTNALNGLGEIEDEIQRQIDANRSKARVAMDLSDNGYDPLAEQEAVLQEEAKDVLERLKAEMKDN